MSKIFELVADRKEFLSKLYRLEKGVKRKLEIILRILKTNPIPARSFDVKKTRRS